MSQTASSQVQSAVLGVDLGTSGVKCVVVAAGQILASATEALNVSSPKPGWSEQDPADWIHAARRAMGRAIAEIGQPKESILGIGLSGQMHGAVTLDAARRPLRPAILWNDNRATAQCAELAEALPGIGQLAGIGPLPGFTAPKLMWMRAQEPGIFAQIRTILLPKDFLALWLTGEIGTDRSDAAGTMWLDQAARAWSPQVAEASGVDLGWLPPLKDGFDQIGGLRPDCAEALGMLPGTPVFAGGGDAATGALALGAAAPGTCFMSLGTSGQLLVVEETYAPDPSKFVHAYCHSVPDLWFRMAAMLNGARPLAWCAQLLGLPVSEMLARATEADLARIPLFLPYLTGERSPHGDPHIRGGFYGLEDATGTPEIARAVVEAVAFSMADALDSFGPEAPIPSPIPVIGGGSQSDLVLQVLADGLDHPVARANAGQSGAALGAALLAEVGTGVRTPAELAFDPEIGPIVVPRADAGLQDRLAQYRALYQALKPFAQGLTPTKS